ncbi:hypothetical protein TIFTF001_039591 [Ficus carica]|uniref:Reverse transcriptase zinc-binding domain-containing protein n=1 Tax=Ficus carica TaxID=3494 RepID=A0AA88JG07_FICCA|nr:hypothetical protein TIFTF001_039591 [Ficus carica]
MNKLLFARLHTETRHEQPRPKRKRQVGLLEVLVCYPGDEIPEWFSYQNVGCSINMKLPPLWKQLCEKLLSSNIQQRHKELWLLLLWDILPVREVLNRQMDVVDTTCPICGMVLESASHLFLYCRSVQPLWFMSRWGLRTDSLCDSMASFLKLILFGDPNSNTHFDGEFLLYASILVDAIWLARNKLVHGVKGFHKADIHSSVQAQFSHIIQLDHLGSCNCVSRSTTRDSDYTAESYPKIAKFSDSCNMTMLIYI